LSNLAEKVRFLSEPGSYGGTTRYVEARETHMSWVFMTDNRVYKLKKPVRYPFLDFSTLQKRQFYCREEFRLNRRLASETYTATVALRRKRSGQLTLSNEGRVIDWLVEMRRLPAQEMLDTRIRQGNVTPTDIGRIGELLAAFYASRSQEPVDGNIYLHHLEHEQAINGSILRRSEFGLSDLADNALDTVDQALKLLRPLVQSRISRGAIVEGHGDLRPEHICLADPPQVIDCLEFNRAMRIIDPYDEVNYLGLECGMLGATWIRPLLCNVLERNLGNPPNAQLMALYGGFRALLRGRLCIAHLLDHPLRYPEKWRPLAVRYISAADKECRILPRALPLRGHAKVQKSELHE
jgi:aminoglycoside phosphotransferase family enzyme